MTYEEYLRIDIGFAINKHDEYKKHIYGEVIGIPNVAFIGILSENITDMFYKSDYTPNYESSFVRIEEDYHNLIKCVMINSNDDKTYSDYYSIRRNLNMLNRIIGAFSARLYKRIKKKYKTTESISNEIYNFLLYCFKNTELDIVNLINKSCEHFGYNVSFGFKDSENLKEHLFSELDKLKNINDTFGLSFKIKSYNFAMIEKHFKKLKNEIDIKGNGVYFLYDDMNQIKYIGFSTVLGDRILQSMKNNMLKNFSFMKCDSERHSRALEKYFIVKYRPEFNGEFKGTVEFDLVDYEIPIMDTIYKLNFNFINNYEEIKKVSLNNPIFYETPIVK